MSFSQLGLSAELLAAVAAEGYTTPTPIQLQGIPAVLTGRDLMACAQTGTGKTAAFTLPLLHRLTASHTEPNHLPRDSAAPKVLVLVPTRELAAQVEDSVRTYGKNSKVRSLAMFGGVGIHPQIQTLRKGVDILVATPGRLMDHMQQGTVNLSRVAVLVLDEADRMLDMGFIRDIRKILAALPAKRQNLMFSATFSEEIRTLSKDFLRDPLSVEVARRNTAAETVTQKVYHVDRERKKDFLLHLFETRSLHHVLIFARTKYGADALSRKLEKAGIKAAAIHGDKSQGARTRVLADFKGGRLTALVATDIAARGIDIDELPCVINYELPNVPEDYVHRIGRTGRAGAGGEAFSLVSPEERVQLRDIVRLLGRPLDHIDVPGFTMAPPAGIDPIRSAPRPARGGQGNKPRGSAPGRSGPAAGKGGPRGGSGRPGHGGHSSGSRRHG